MVIGRENVICVAWLELQMSIEQWWNGDWQGEHDNVLPDQGSHAAIGKHGAEVEWRPGGTN